MKTKQIIETLQNFNAWNQGEDQRQDFSLNDTMNAIDAAIERLQTLEKERDEARIEADIVRSFLDADYARWTFPWEEGNK